MGRNDMLTTKAVAELLGIEPVTWRAYVHRGRAPKADGYLGPTPYWLRSTIEKWEAPRVAARAR